MPPDSGGSQAKRDFKKSNFLICLTPFACRSGQTSSMLGGAQFKATLLDQKALFSNIQCKMTDSNSWQTRKDGKQLPAASDVNRGSPLPAHSSAQRPLWAENAVLQEVNQFHKSSELSVYACKLVFYSLSNPNPHLTHILLSNTHWISLIPRWNTDRGLQSLSSS